MQRVLGGLLLGAAMLVGGCTAPPTETDADQGIQCAADRDCSDGQFCNGIELCLPRSTNADERGCVAPNASPCQDSQTCDATNGTCVTRCELAPDADADGHLAVACGGDDCDDSDPDRFPGNLEVCDDLMHDEDCSPTTFGDLDADSDGWYSAACCNVDGAGTLFCGDDCNDSESTAHPSEAEACDGIDNDCDDAVDEGGRVFYEDRDGDGFGSTAGVSVEACRKPDGFAEDNTDCDDLVGGRNPGAPEVCDLIPDNDCDDTTHPFDDDGDGYDRVSCGGSDCNDANVEVYPGAPEVCDGSDNDCSSGGGAATDEDSDGDGHAATTASCLGGYPTDDCDDLDSRAHPGAPEVCDGVDNNCDGFADENPSADMSCMLPGTVATCGVDECVIAMCVAPRLNCNGRTDDGCEADITSDVLHCGECGLPCADGAECVDRTCRCPVGTLDCISACVDDMNDPLNCGDCGRACPAGALCEMGVCACPAGQTLCGGACFDTQVSPGHCGECDLRCGEGNECSVGGCVTSPITALTAGGETACVRRENGNVACWGRDPATLNGRNLVPKIVDAVGEIQEIHTTYAVACARRSTGQIWCWGTPYDNLLGRPTSGSDPLPPGPVAGLEDAIAMDLERTAGMIPNANAMGCAVRSGGTVLCWGRGNLGRTGVTTAETPIAVVGLSDVASVAVGGNFSCALRNDGRVACWGSNRVGQLGNATAGGLSETPVLVTGLSDAVEIAAGAEAICARRASGQVSCWGDQFGTAPSNVVALTNIAQITMGPGHLCALGTDSSLKCMGTNNDGQLGDGSTMSSTSPVTVVGDFAEVRAMGSNDLWTSGTTCARRVTGGVACWGLGTQGQLGDGNQTSSSVVVDVVGL